MSDVKLIPPNFMIPKCSLCDKPSNNVTMDLCSEHIDELRIKSQKERQIRQALQRQTARPILLEDIEKAEVCPHCGSKTEDVCCGEIHHEEMYSYEGSDFMPWDEFTLHFRPLRKQKETETIVTLCDVCNRHGPNCACEPEYREER